MSLPLSIGRKAPTPELVDLLSECHARIRRFLLIARELAHTVAPPVDDIRATAKDVRRYFGESMPLHVADEHDIADRFAGRDPAVDTTLRQIRDDHAHHEPPLARLVELCGRLEDDPTQHAALAGELANVVEVLATELEGHLELEERSLFPFLRTLPASEREALRTAFRTRRDAAMRRS
jgi:hemerythrin-like domain-containing protein